MLQGRWSNVVQRVFSPGTERVLPVLVGSILGLLLGVSGCSGGIAAGPEGAPTDVTVTNGLLVEAVPTSFMYGTHLLYDRAGTLRFALRSDSVALERYEGERVLLRGQPVEGYPVEGGPLLLDVTSIKRLGAKRP